MKNLVFVALMLMGLSACVVTDKERLASVEACTAQGEPCPVVLSGDTDGDGVGDSIDQCPRTPVGAVVDSVGCEAAAPPPPPEEHLLTDATVGQWVEIPNTKLVDVLPPEAFQPPIKYVVGPAVLASAWSGASWNEAAQEMHFIAGGGHADYCGNQHIKFDLDDLSVTLVRGPSSLGDKTYTELGDEGMTPDGNPNSRHTYGGTVYDSTRDLHYLFPGSSCDPAGDSDRKVWSADNNTGITALLMDESPTSQGWRGSRNQAIYDPVNDEVWVNNMGAFYRFDLATHTRTLFQPNQPQFFYGFKQGSAFDVDRRTILYTGGGSFWAYNIGTDTLNKYTDKGLEFKDCYGPGLTFSESLDRYIAWCGTNDIFLIAPVNYSVTVQATAGTAPTKAASGDHGKMRWSEKYGGIVVVSNSTSNARFLKL